MFMTKNKNNNFLESLTKTAEKHRGLIEDINEKERLFNLPEIDAACEQLSIASAVPKETIKNNLAELMFKNNIDCTCNNKITDCDYYSNTGIGSKGSVVFTNPAPVYEAPDLETVGKMMRAMFGESKTENHGETFTHTFSFNKS